MATKTQDLEWGTTPWDGMTKEELLLTVKKMYVALTAASSVCRVQGGLGGAYWGPGGAGGRAIELSNQVLDPIHAEHDSGTIYSRYFRYAEDLLFERKPGCMIGHGWAVCPECGTMTGSDRSGYPFLDQVCGELRNSDCKGVLRELEWSDLDPKWGEK